MLKLSPNGIMSFVEGDAFNFSVFVNDGTTVSPVRHTMASGETAVFVLYAPNAGLDDFEFSLYNSGTDKDGNPLFHLSSEATAGIAAGEYYYIVYFLGRTIVTRTKVVVYPGVTKMCRCTFKNYDGTVLADYKMVAEHLSAVYNIYTWGLPKKPSDESIHMDYEFSGWDLSLDDMMEDRVFTAQYRNVSQLKE